ncbi:hypothetical protein LUZ63_007613 [Rhynchospora breviuscula]|uniref:Insulin-degrading enzyme n=1 Tax=Rhynchospora breviuscula TaxID=2022672 RepID=A0A9Q0HUQ5_9POAL|nr:hypothetical protein LUZ63_007613 [Rhynchospora breviuscula]
MGSLTPNDNEVIKSPMDKRSYKIVHLSNGLSALLVHDPEIYPDGYPLQSEERDPVEQGEKGKEESGEINGEGSDVKGEKRKTSASSPTKQAAAAMCVRMGSFSDPPNAHGLAHFLEHMLFMGSSEFPDENEYASYLSKHGGSSNAFTEWEYTCYYFDINREFLLEALKRFSQFFISPLVKEDALEREVLAVDSEFNQVLQNDSCRLSQLHCETSTPNHPVNKFSWGNKKSLYEAMGNGVNMREEVLKMFNENYHGGMMKLVVIGGEPIEILEDWVSKLFIKVKAGPPLKMAIEKKITPFWKQGKQYKLEAVKDVHNLDLSWTLPCLHNEYLKKPHCYLGHLLGHEGKGSLCSFLKAKGWAASVGAGVGSEGTHRSAFAYIFAVTIQLTSEGLEKMYEVIDAVYQYIKLLRESKLQDWIFKELQEIGNMEFRFAEEQSQDDYAVDLSVNSLFYPEKHIICGAYVYDEWDPVLIEHILSFFSPENMRIDLVTKSFDKESTAVQYEPWFGSRYIEEDIPLHLLDTWRDPVKIDSSLHLPLKNEFVPSDFTLKSAKLLKSLKSAKPKCILDEPLIKLWYKMDQTFNVPRANVYFLMTLKDAYASLRNSLLTELFVDLLRDELNELLYQAGIAGLGNSLSNFDDKMEIRIWGYNDKLSVLLSKILLIFSSFSPAIDRFKVIKEDMERAYRNSNLEPLDHSAHLRLHILYERSWELEEQLSTLQNLTLSDLLDFIPTLLSQMHIEGLCHGNLTEEEAINISNIFTNSLSVKPLPKELRYYDKVLCIPTGASLIKSVNVKNKPEVNSVVELYFQFEQQLRGREAIRLGATTDLFDDLINEPFFDQLRTKEQLGYTVTCGPRLTAKVLGFCFVIQSSEYNPLYLQNRIDNFIDGLQKLLDGIDDGTFEHHRSGLIAKKLEKVPSLVREADNYWDEITMQRYNYGIHEAEAEELKTIQKRDVIDLYKTYIKPDSDKCRRLAIHVWGCNTDVADVVKMQQSPWKVIDDIGSLKLSSEFYQWQH